MYEIKVNIQQLIRLQVMVATKIQEYQEFLEDPNGIGNNIFKMTLKDLQELAERLSDAKLK